MRFKLTLQIQPEVMGNELPINYQFPLQAAIYKTLANSDAEFATWLHENGYQQDGKRFKLFTFSNLIVPQYGIGKERERLEIKSDYVTLLISFLPEKSTQKFIEGIFNNRTIQIADHLSGVQFVVREIQVMSPLNYKPDMVFHTLSNPSRLPIILRVCQKIACLIIFLNRIWRRFPPRDRLPQLLRELCPAPGKHSSDR